MHHRYPKNQPGSQVTGGLEIYNLKEPCLIESQTPLFLEGPMILRVYLSGQIIIIRRSLGRISYFQMEISLGR